MNIGHVSRRQILAGTGALITWAYQTRIAGAVPGRDPRLLVINLRGGLDGVGAVAPVGDPDYHRLRGEAVLSPDDPARGLPLDGFFVLHPALPTLGRLYRSGDALIAHAVSTPYRQRSHFDAQDVLESGLPGVGRSRSGWLNRALGALPRGDRLGPASGLVVGATVPLLLRGEAEVLSWMPPGYAAAGEDIRGRLADLYRHTDPELLRVFKAALRLDDLSGETAAQAAMGRAAPSRPGALDTARMTAAAVGRLLLDPAGPRVGAMDLSGWDTHVDGEPFDARFVGQLERLDAVLHDLAESLAPVWRQTIVCAVTEFGRTVRLNGSGTDHGVGTVAILAGGAVRGGRVLADWPGLGASALYEGRDLLPTLDIRSLFKGLLRDHLGVDQERLVDAIFPDSAGVPPIDDLVRL
ncbi:DUF1501 domain-containing protein [Chthonobacter rhizosphaerae]|uniref:DUF1501 domain-containing protein n=1 Tax=Chthonobacter rhizosphaerae TaxID=2735553 RepID=UPI0015EE947C|nr:DUF1501 domain-containing protein [Chthonobacter rhizosphaerae]